MRRKASAPSDFGAKAATSCRPGTREPGQDGHDALPLGAFGALLEPDQGVERPFSWGKGPIRCLERVLGAFVVPKALHLPPRTTSRRRCRRQNAPFGCPRGPGSAFCCSCSRQRPLYTPLVRLDEEVVALEGRPGPSWATCCCACSSQRGA